MNGSPTIADVAREAGVSQGTVSGVLNHSDSLAPETVLHVQSVIRALGYVPRRNCRRRRPGPTNHLVAAALLVPDRDVAALTTVLARGLAAGVQRVLRDNDTAMRLLHLAEDGSLPGDISRREIAGVIVRSGGLVPALGVPAVWTFESGVAPLDADCVVVDNRYCGEWAAQEALRRGCRRALCSVPPDNLALEIRAVTFAFTMRRGGAAAEVVHANLADIDEGAFDAIFIPGHDSDITTADTTLRVRGRQLGKDVELLAVATDGEGLAAALGPAVHLISIDAEKVGMVAAQQLLWRLRYPQAEPRRLLVSPHRTSRNQTPHGGSAS